MTSGPPGASIAMTFIFVGSDSAELTAAQNPSAATATLNVRVFISAQFTMTVAIHTEGTILDVRRWRSSALKSRLLANLLICQLTAAQAQVLDGRLFVGTNYQPVDRSEAQVRNDIARMKQAGFNIVRMGDLSWDYFEPSDGRFDFAAFDAVMDQMQAAGIRVILDIPGQPAPIWLHHAYPGVDIVTQQGVRLDAAERYMDNIADPDYRRLLARMTQTLTARYAKHFAAVSRRL